MIHKGLKQIGRGQFSSVYIKNKNTVLIKSRDKVKECMALYFRDSRLFPKIQRIDTSGDEIYSYYEEKYYPRVKSLRQSLKPREYEFYKELRRVEEKNFITPKNKHENYYFWYKAFESLPSKFRRKKEILLIALDDLSNYGSDIGFEISPRNVAVNNGNLILLDCFFFVSDLKR